MFSFQEEVMALDIDESDEEGEDTDMDSEDEEVQDVLRLLSLQCTL